MVTRFIYCYRWKATGVPVYVGSAFDMAYRDYGHCTDNEIPFDKLITEQGRAAFTLEILEEIRSKTKSQACAKAMARENYWMDRLRTWHEYGGHNFGRAVVTFTSDDHYKAWLAATTAASVRKSKDPKWRAAHRAVINSPEYKKSMRATMQKKGFEVDSPYAIKRREKIEQGLCGADKCRNKLWRGHALCRSCFQYDKESRARCKARKKAGITTHGNLIATHNRYHVARRIINPSCTLCRTL